MKSYTDIEQSKKLAEILPLESADMLYYCNKSNNIQISQHPFIRSFKEKDTFSYLPCWSLAALLKLIPKHILRKDKIHYGQTFIPSFRWEITPTAIYYTDGNNIMDYVSFRYGENNKELIDAVFEMVIKLKERNLI